jgi:saccharopine dehydrogenase-like NADP-dependent oxidoreductase
MKGLVVGCGKVGSEIAADLASTRGFSEVVVADAVSGNLARVRAVRNVRTVKASLAQKGIMKQLMRDADVVCGALPGRIGFGLLEQAVEEGKNIVDISYTPKNPLLLNHRALERGCTVVPQCGVAPGFTNMCVGDASKKMDKMNRVRVFVGGIPEKPEPPLNYRIVFSLDDVINEYTRPVRIIENGKRKTVEPLTGRGLMNFPGVGNLEYFLTDGLGTLPQTFPGVREMQELTLRYPGHAEIIDALRRLGFFSLKQVRLDGLSVEPRRLSLEVLKQALAAGAPEDILALRVEVEGVNKRRKVMMSYSLLDRYDRRRRVSAMARTTAYPCTSAAILLAKGMLTQKGVVPPEKIATDQKLFRFVTARLREHGVMVRTQLKVIES